MEAGTQGGREEGHEPRRCRTPELMIADSELRWYRAPELMIADDYTETVPTSALTLLLA